MNLFYMSTNIYECAAWLDDKRLNKMILETTQLLCTAARTHLPPNVCNDAGLYKATHKNHPWAIWVRENGANYNQAWHILCAYLLEYQMRFGKIHACSRLSFPLYQMRDRMWPRWEYQSEQQEQTEMPKCFHPLVSRELEVCEGYRETMRIKWLFDIRLPKWTKRGQPSFLEANYAKQS